MESGSRCSRCTKTTLLWKRQCAREPQEKPSDFLGRKKLLWFCKRPLEGYVPAQSSARRHYSTRASTALPAGSTDLRHPRHSEDLRSNLCQGHEAHICLALPSCCVSVSLRGQSRNGDASPRSGQQRAQQKTLTPANGHSYKSRRTTGRGCRVVPKPAADPG